DHAADAGKPCQGAEDDSAGEGAEERSGAGGGRAVGEIVESDAQSVAGALFPSPLVGEGGADEVRDGETEVECWDTPSRRTGRAPDNRRCDGPNLRGRHQVDRIKRDAGLVESPSRAWRRTAV